MKSAQAASEIKPTLQQVYINKFNLSRKLKSTGKNIVTSSKEKPSKPWWIYPYSAELKKFTQHLKMPQKILQQQEKLLNKRIMPPTFSPISNQNKNVNLSPDVEIIKITTVVEAIRQKQKNAQILETAKNIQKIIGKKRSKRSSYELKNNSTVIKNTRHAQQKKTFVSNEKSRYPKPHYRKQQTRTLPTRKHAADLKTVNNIGIPSTVFYKRIWEYINGTRPHSDIISGYNSLENNSEKDNSTCTDKDRNTASQSQEDKSQVISPKPERDFYKRIWDIINATHSTYENAKIRSKRNASIPKSNAASTPLCVQEKAVDYEEDKQVQSTNEKTSFGITDTINSPEISNSGPYISGFWTIANKTQWQPKKIPVVNIAKLNNDPILSLVNSASEVDDLNKFPDKVKNVDYLSSDNSTEHSNESRNASQEIITEPGPPYSSEESFATFSLSPTESDVDKISQEKDQAKHVENYSTGTTPNYNPLNIPYVEVPDYSDQQKDSLDKNNQSATAARYKEYDSDYDYEPKQLYDANDFSSKSPSAEIKVVQTESDEPEILYTENANNSRSSCIEGKDSAKCTDKYDVEDTKLRNNTEEVTDDVRHSAENSTELASEEHENSDFIDFDINEYKKPINWDEFYKNDPILKSITTGFKENTEYDHKENPNRTEESEEVETYATDPKEQSHDYFPKNQNSHDDHRVAFDDRDKAKEETDSYAKKEAKKSEITDKDHYPYDNKDFFKHIFGKDTDKESEYDHKENPDRPEESEEVKTYATDPKEQSHDYFPKNEDSHEDYRNASDDKEETKEVTDSYAKKEAKESEEQIDKDYYPYNDEDFFKHIFRKDNDKESFDAVDTKNEFLSRHFTEDVLHQLQDNSTAEEDRQREKSRNREDIHKTLSKILDKKDHFSRLDENLNKMIEKGETIPIKYNNFWSLEYESPGKKNKEETEDSKEEA